MLVLPFFHPIFFYQNDSKWPEMDFKHNFKKCSIWSVLQSFSNHFLLKLARLLLKHHSQDGCGALCTALFTVFSESLWSGRVWAWSSSVHGGPQLLVAMPSCDEDQGYTDSQAVPGCRHTPASDTGPVTSDMDTDRLSSVKLQCNFNTHSK